MESGEFPIFGENTEERKISAAGFGRENRDRTGRNLKNRKKGIPNRQQRADPKTVRTGHLKEKFSMQGKICHYLLTDITKNGKISEKINYSVIEK